jgi:two-component system response regulator VanR
MEYGATNTSAKEKMNDSIDHPKYIKTVWGIGYKIEK